MNHYPNLSNREGTAGNAMIALIQKADTYTSVDTFKVDFIEAVNNAPHMSPEKRAGYIKDLDNIHNLRRMCQFVTNIFCKSDNLGLL